MPRPSLLILALVLLVVTCDAGGLLVVESDGGADAGGDASGGDE